MKTGVMMLKIQICFTAVVLNLFFFTGRTIVQVQVSRAARMSFKYYVINTNQLDL